MEEGCVYDMFSKLVPDIDDKRGEIDTELLKNLTENFEFDFPRQQDHRKTSC